MERSKWILSITLVFLIATFSLTLPNMELNQLIPYTYLGDLTNMILGKLGGWSLGDHELSEESKKGARAVGPNLTTCHASFGRKDYLVHCCPPGFETPVPFVDFQFPDPQSPKRVRRPAHLLDENYISKYNKALSIMKSLPYNDPRSFIRQANMHCLFCTAAYDQQNNNAPISIHRTWLFFPWHRMMIYFHERIVGSLIGDDTFALPVWTWDIPEGMFIPNIYMNKSLSLFSTERDESHFSPKVADLNYVSETNLRPEEQIDTNLAFMYNQMVSGARKMELFMGCIYKSGKEGYCNGPGTIELAPHNALHTWVGSNLNPGREDMGKFYSAAKDPIFYAHHSNIDRLWEVWREMNKNQLDIKDPDWLDSFFFFYDENLQLVRIRVRDVLDIDKLGYSYEDVDRPWLNNRPKPSVPPKLARQILNRREKENKNKLRLPSNNLVSSSDFGTCGRVLDTSLTVKVNRPKHRFINQDEEEVIVVYGIEVKGDEYVKFDVFVNVVDETKITTNSREFAGTFAHISGGRNMNRKKNNLKLGVSELLQDLEANHDETIWVTLLPKTTSCSNVTIAGVRIEYIK